MTLEQILPTAAGYALCFAQTFLWIGAIALCLLAFNHRRQPLVLGFDAALLCLSFLCTALLLDTFYRWSYTIDSPVAILRWAYDQPWWLYAIVISLEAVAEGALLMGHVHYTRHRLSPFAFKEGMDMLPMGVCFGDAKGTVCMANLRIHQYCVQMQCAPLVDIEKFWQQIGAMAILNKEDSRLVQVGETVVMFRSCFVEVDGIRYRQITAIDITQQYLVTNELQSKNIKLRDIQMRIKQVAYQLNDLVLAQELLDARVTVHDDIGHLLLRGKYYLDNPGAVTDDEMLVMLDDVNLHLLEQIHCDEQDKDEYIEAVQLAQAIGVHVSTIGDVPKHNRLRDLMARTVRECATNAVKHARGDALQVRIDANAHNLIVTVTNNGDAPTAPVVPSGGLASLQQNIEALGGTMLVNSRPTFTLTIVVPKHDAV